MNAKEIIIKRFKDNVFGKRADTSSKNLKHSGKDGHWLEEQMGVAANASNAPDLFGYEMKNETTSKTTFGDWSGDYYIYKDSNYGITRNDFLEIFGKPNAQKDNRLSWSGEPIPTVSRNSPHNGSELVINENGVYIIYHFSMDPRPDKAMLVPEALQRDNLIIVSWSRSLLENKLTRKFSQAGWFRCRKDANGIYNRIEFGAPMSFDNWMILVKAGVVFFDPGMYEGNPRPYSQWRANNQYWDSLVVDYYPPFPSGI